MSIESMLDILKPKTKTGAVIMLFSCTVFMITYFIWTNYFVIASIYIAVYLPLMLVLFIVIDMLFNSVVKLWKSSKVVEQVKADFKSTSTPVPKSGMTNLLDMNTVV